MTSLRTALFLRMAELLGALPLADSATTSRVLAGWAEIRDQVAGEVDAMTEREG